MRLANKLSKSDRDLLMDSDFAIPEERKFPIQDEAQAKIALTMAKWPGNKKHQKRVEKAIAERYPQLLFLAAPALSTARGRNCSFTNPAGRTMPRSEEYPVLPEPAGPARRSKRSAAGVIAERLRKSGWTIVPVGSKFCAYSTDPNTATTRYVVESDTVRAQEKTQSGWKTKQQMTVSSALRRLEGK